MPVVTEKPVRAFAHCHSPMCPGYGQQEVDAVDTETAFAYLELGGDIPGIEKSSHVLAFKVPEQRACPSCGGPRELSDNVRPSYEPLSAGLHQSVHSVADQDAGMREHVARLEAQVQLLTESLTRPKANPKAGE